MLVSCFVRSDSIERDFVDVFLSKSNFMEVIAYITWQYAETIIHVKIDVTRKSNKAAIVLL
jgi:hypothetical protein